jgi:hypothetical protein
LFTFSQRSVVPVTDVRDLVVAVSTSVLPVVAGVTLATSGA